MAEDTEVERKVPRHRLESWVCSPDQTPIAARQEAAGMGSRGWVRSAAVVCLATLLIGVVADRGDAGLYRRSRNGIFELVADVRICRDGIEFVAGEEFADESSRARVHLVLIDERGVPRLDFTADPIPVTPDPAQVVPGWTPTVLIVQSNLVRTTRPWSGNVKLRPGTRLTAQLPFLPGEGGVITFPSANEAPLVVQPCKVFKPQKIDVDIRPDDRRNVIDPTSSAPVSIAFLGSPTFDAHLLDVSTVRIGTAPPSAGVGGDIDGDGDFDVVLTFSPSAAGITCGTRRVEVTASSNYGWPLRARERVRTTC
jgi:hypothetical protein